MNDGQAISAFSALAQETRLGFLRALIKAGEPGLASGALAEMLGVSTASSSFHLGHLEHAGLVISKRKSRSIIYYANYENIGAMIQFLLQDCCGNDPRITNCC